MDTSHQTWNPAEPLALFEWQGTLLTLGPKAYIDIDIHIGGAFSYWSGPGYDECYQLINEQFANVSLMISASLFNFLSCYFVGVLQGPHPLISFFVPGPSFSALE